MNPALKSALLRLGFFVAIAFVALLVSTFVLLWIVGQTQVLVVAVLSTFFTATVSNALALRIFERGRLADVGLGWTAASRRNLLVGLLGGIAAGVIVLLVPLVFRGAEFRSAPNGHFDWANLVGFSVLLVFGAVGEELLFRGYGFQVFVAGVGPFAAILPVSILFAFMHGANPGFGLLALFNTFLWGVLLGYSFLCSGDLWLPIGLHFGWNWVLPLLGVNLSGITMGITGYTMNWRMGDLWSGGSYGVEGGLLTTVIVVLVFVYLHKAPIESQQPYLLYKDRT